MKKTSHAELCRFRRHVIAAAGCGLVLTAMPSVLSAQTGRDPIIVDGQRLAPELARQRAVGFVRSTGVAAGETPVARWTDPVCPRVLGLTPDGARSAEGMIRAIATEVGIQVAAEPCDSNVVVSFTSNAAAIVREIARREPRRLSDLDPGVRAELLNGTAPIRWWHTSEVRAVHSGSDGRQGRSAQAMLTPNTHDGSGAGSALANDVPTMMHYQNSIISTLSERRLLSATVIIDQDAVMGRRLSAIAAYAALVAFAEIRPATASTEGSILGLFGSETPPTRLTAQDVGFLQTLYRLPLDRQARHHRGLLVGGMVSATSIEAAN